MTFLFWNLNVAKMDLITKVIECKTNKQGTLDRRQSIVELE